MGGAVIIGAVILWIVPVFVANAQGKAKNRAGVLYGLLLGWLGVLVLAVLHPHPDTLHSGGQLADADHQLATAKVVTDPKAKVASLRRALAHAGNDRQALTEISSQAREIASAGIASSATRLDATTIANAADERLQAGAVERPSSAPVAPVDDALSIARRRYASGELSREDFQQIESDLRARPVSD